MWLSLFLELAAFLCLFLGASTKLNMEHAWVESKNQQQNVSTRQMEITINELKAYKASGDKKFNFTYQYFVTSIGYSDGAINLAKETGVICYIQKNNSTFELVPYWSHNKTETK